MRVLRLVLMALFGMWAGATGCAEETLPGQGSQICADEFEPTLTCVAFCTNVEECPIFPIPSVEECVQVCECQLAGGRAISPACGDALASEYACGAALDCPDFMDFFTRLPSRFPCFAEVAEVDTHCGTS